DGETVRPFLLQKKLELVDRAHYLFSSSRVLICAYILPARSGCLNDTNGLALYLPSDTDRSRCDRKSERYLAPSIEKHRVLVDLDARRLECINDGVGIGVTHCHAADHDAFVGETQLAPNDVGITCDRRFGTRVQAARAGREHDRLQEHAVVEPASDLKLAINRVDQTDRRAE